jgi:V/A-type H+-transporting ATPase subunit I
MAIVKMNKISAIGLDTVKDGLIKELMDLGVVQINSQDSKLTDPDWISYIERDGNESEVLCLEAKLSKINTVIENLEKHDKSKSPMFVTRKIISSSEYENSLKNKGDIENKVEHIFNLISKLNELITEENKIVANIISLKPWVSYNIPMELNETNYTSVFIGIVPTILNIENLRGRIEEKTNRCIVDLIASDKDQDYISIVCMKADKEDVYEVLKQFGFNAVTFKDVEGTSAENIVRYEQKVKDIAVKKASVELKISEFVKNKGEIYLLHDYLTMERDRYKVLNSMLKTKKTFYINGWVPENCKENIECVLKKNECWYEFEQPQKDEEYPILLNNTSFVQPFESITELYSLPSATNVDPTALMSIFYFAFFGLMLADVGYGLIMSLGCFFILKKYNIEGTMKKMFKMFFYCGLSTIFWGLMFGSWFGDAITTIAKVMFNTEFVIEPIWINPINEPMTLLIFSFILGLIHLFIGMGVKAYIMVRDGHPWEALFDVGFWYGLIIGLSLLLFGNSIISGSGTIGKWMSIIFALGLVLTQGRDKTNIFSKFLSGLLSLYNITSYLSDVLSYSRLLALGLATGVISAVISVLGSLGGGGFFGSLLLIIVLLFGHTFNIAINGLGSFVHAARLQYVEFFGKFYEGGGDMFNPLIKKTKYIKITKEVI